MAHREAAFEGGRLQRRAPTDSAIGREGVAQIADHTSRRRHQTT